MICQNSDCGKRYAKGSGGGKCVFCEAYLCPACFALETCPECDVPRSERLKKNGRPKMIAAKRTTEQRGVTVGDAERYLEIVRKYRGGCRVGIGTNQ